LLIHFDLSPKSKLEVLILFDTKNLLTAKRFLAETRLETPFIINFTNPLELQSPTALEVFIHKTCGNIYYYMEILIQLSCGSMTRPEYNSSPLAQTLASKKKLLINKRIQ